VSEPRFTGHIESGPFNAYGEQRMPPARLEESGLFIRSHRWPQNWWLNAVLFFLTLITTTVFGFALVQSFSSGYSLDIDWIVKGYARFAHGSFGMWSGLRFSVPLLVILLAHELGHYLTSRHWGVDASLPYFLPSPTLFGTFGAFIRIRSPIYTRKILFDIGVSGPIAGFVVLAPFLIAGVCMSKVVPGGNANGTFILGTPLFMRFIEWLRFPGVSPADIALHPMAMAAWAGLLATAINLLPIGQSDGGHILYAVFGERWHRILSISLIGTLIVLGFFYAAWWIWAVLMFFFGRRHPLVYDQTPLTTRRLIVSAIATILFVLSISIVPVRTR